MKRVVAIASGEVQSVGYRDIIKKTARRLGVTGRVRNLMPYDVEIIAEADEEVLTGFIEAINIQEYPVLWKTLMSDGKPEPASTTTLISSEATGRMNSLRRWILRAG